MSTASGEHALSLMDIESFIGHSLEKMEISENLLHRTQAPDASSRHSKKKVGKQQNSFNQNKKNQKNKVKKEENQRFSKKTTEPKRQDQVHNSLHEQSKNSGNKNESLVSSFRDSSQRKKREIPAIG